MSVTYLNTGNNKQTHTQLYCTAMYCKVHHSTLQFTAIKVLSSPSPLLVSSGVGWSLICPQSPRLSGRLE